MISVDIAYEVEDMELRAPQDLVHSVVVKALHLMGQTEGELSCTFVSDETMTEMNLAYRGKEESTDILSFVQTEAEDEFPFPMGDSAEPMLGDLVISLDTMDQNCVYFSVEPEEELLRLLIHGVLHLLGFDHASNEMTEPMLQKQEELLKMVTKELGK